MTNSFTNSLLGELSIPNRLRKAAEELNNFGKTPRHKNLDGFMGRGVGAILAPWPQNLMVTCNPSAEMSILGNRAELSMPESSRSRSAECQNHLLCPKEIQTAAEWLDHGKAMGDRFRRPRGDRGELSPSKVAGCGKCYCCLP